MVINIYEAAIYNKWNVIPHYNRAETRHDSLELLLLSDPLKRNVSVLRNEAPAL